MKPSASWGWLVYEFRCLARVGRIQQEMGVPSSEKTWLAGWLPQERKEE